MDMTCIYSRHGQWRPRKNVSHAVVEVVALHGGHAVAPLPGKEKGAHVCACEHFLRVDRDPQGERVGGLGRAVCGNRPAVVGHVFPALRDPRHNLQDRRTRERRSSSCIWEENTQNVF